VALKVNIEFEDCGATDDDDDDGDDNDKIIFIH